VKTWWRQRSLRFRLTAAYAAISAAALCGLGALCLWILQLRLRSALDVELREDYDTIEVGLKTDPAGHFEWNATPLEKPGVNEREGPRFEILSLTGAPLFSNGEPIDWRSNVSAKPYETRYFSTPIPGLGLVRVLEKTGRFGTRNYIVRVLEPESFRPVTELAGVLTVGLPLTILLASLGGYFVAGRTLAPLSEISALARRITADSLSDRLPIRNPYDEVGALATIFNQTLTRLEESFISLRRFAADASHELRTPVAAFRAIGEAALETHPSDSVRLAETLGHMLEEAGRLSNLIDALLVLARADSGKLPVVLEPVNAVALATEAKDLVGVLAEEKEQKISVEVRNSKIPLAMADRELLRLALLNLLDNAIRYSPAGTPITLSVDSPGASITIDVIDRGLGIPASQQQKVFERFYRIDEARSRANGGSGLGLSIAKSVLQSQNASIQLTSQEGKGSVFHIELPVAILPRFQR
jgi:signal transduction histidine kinase